MAAATGRTPWTRVSPRDAYFRQPGRGRAVMPTCAAEQLSTSSTGSPVAEVGTCTLLGTSRKNNEDRFDYQFVTEDAEVGEINSYVAMFDGHGGIAVSESLEANFRTEIEKFWDSGRPEAGIAKAYINADRELLQCPPGFFGMFAERGVGGSRCGATAATACIYREKGGTQKLLAANIGDSRVILVRDGKAVQLTQDHVPDAFVRSAPRLGCATGLVLREEERQRIERENPNPRMPLVRFVGGTWRVGGILALSRAFGDAYMKPNLQFEGVDAGSDYRTGFGVIAEPYTSMTDLKSAKPTQIPAPVTALPSAEGDAWLLVHSDGLNNTETRGGGGGLTNEQIAAFCSKEGENAQALAETLAAAAQKAGSTDDVSVVCIKLDV